MKKKHLAILAASALLICSCSKSQSTENKSNEAEVQDTVVAEVPDLVGDSALTSTAQFYYEQVDSRRAQERMAKVDTILLNDMTDLQQEATFAFYPFGGPDFLFPHHIFPNADIYFMMGLEKPGVVPTTKDQSKIKDYTAALQDYFGRSYYITSYMREDLAATAVNGTLPIITMLMAMDDCQIISVKMMKFDENGNMNPAEEKANIAEIKFFSNKTPKHLQTVYYYSGDTNDKRIEEGLKAYLAKTLPRYKVGTFLKAASYIMYTESFNTIRNAILDNSFAVLQDDSGMRYRHFKKGWDLTFYGTYVPPISDFPASYYQKDLDSLYKARKNEIKPLTIRIGYDIRSNWMCARKQK